jgi:hypothetical protein
MIEQKKIYSKSSIESITDEEAFKKRSKSKVKKSK